MWIKIEGGRLLNLDMLTDIIPDHQGKIAQALSCAITIAHSKILYTKVCEEKVLEVKE